MKSLAALTLPFFLSMALLPIPKAQSTPQKNELLRYNDPDGYQVMSAVIDAKTSKSKGLVFIFNRTFSEDSFQSIRLQCKSSIPNEFQGAVQDLDRETKTRFQMQAKFSMRNKYRLVSAKTEPQTLAGSLPGVFAFSSVGFDEAKIHAIVLVEYLVHPAGGMAGGSRTFYLMRKTEKGWQEATEIQKCGRIY